jgi:tight adherence protein C
MDWQIVGVTFMAATLFMLALVYAFTPGSLVITERLSRLWLPAVDDEKFDFGKKQKQKLERLLSDMGKLLPSKNVSKMQRMMIRAGYRRAEAVTAMRGAKIILPPAFLALVFFTGFSQQSPVFIPMAAGCLGFFLPDLWLTWSIRRRQRKIRSGLPDALDLMVICVEAGLALDQALLRVAQELRIAHPELCEELDLVSAEMRLGKTRMDALRELGVRTGVDDIKGLVAMLIQTDRFGTSIAQSLRVHSDDLRGKRRQRAEEAAAKTTVKMVPPLVFFIFPALFVVILGPAVITIYTEFFGVMHK